MKFTLVAVVLLLVGVSFPQDQDCAVIQSKDLIDSSAPKFEDYAVTAPKRDVHPQLDVASNPIAKTYRTVLRNEIRTGPNFAGYYRVADWGSASSLDLVVVVNLLAGLVSPYA